MARAACASSTRTSAGSATRATLTCQGLAPAAPTRRWSPPALFSNSEGSSAAGAHPVLTAARNSSQTEILPESVDSILDIGLHRDRPAPDARCFRGQLVGGVDCHLRSQPRDRAREIEIVDRRVFDDEHVAAPRPP